MPTEPTNPRQRQLETLYEQLTARIDARKRDIQWADSEHDRVVRGQHLADLEADRATVVAYLDAIEAGQPLPTPWPPHLVTMSLPPTVVSPGEPLEAEAGLHVQTHGVVGVNLPGAQAGRDININNVHVNVHQSTGSSPYPVALHQLPPDISDFTGRQEKLGSIISSLTGTENKQEMALRVCAIAGMAGVGKSALAVHAGHQLAPHFADAQLWVDLRSEEDVPLKASDVLVWFLSALGIPNESIPSQIGERSALFRSLLSDKHALVLLDNATSEEQVRPLLPGSPTCAVLITSRRLLSALEGIELIDLPELGIDEAYELLERLVGAERVHVESEAALRIIKLCGQLPLALRIAGAKLKVKKHWTLKDYADQLENEHKRLELLEVGDLSVRASFEISYRDLTPNDARLFRLSALQIESSFIAALPATLTETPLDKAWEALERLGDLRLLEPAGKGRYRFHDLVRLFAHGKLSEVETSEAQESAQLRRDEWYLTVDGVYFYTQAAVLDRYSKMDNPNAIPAMVDLVIELLRSRPDLRGQFFRSGPNAAWAPILWERGFFDRPPEPLSVGTGYILPSWDVQDFLAYVGGQVPELVIKHVASIEGHGRYLSKAIEGLQRIQAYQVTPVLDRVREWLNNPETAEYVASSTFELILCLEQLGAPGAAIALFRELVMPLPLSPSDRVGTTLDYGRQSFAKFRSIIRSDEVLSLGSKRLGAHDPVKVISILEESLLTVLQLEAAEHGSATYDSSSWWRPTIEQKDPDYNDDYKDGLVDVLRDTLLWFASTDPAATRPILERYLTEPYGILRRVGLHVLYRYPEQFRPLVTQELLSFGELENSRAHRELLLLLQSGFRHLQTSDQELLIAAIVQGPSEKRLDEWTENGRLVVPDLDVGDFVTKQRQMWTRDRLWMIGDDLPSHVRLAFDELVAAVGMPDDPTLTHGLTGGSFSVKSVSPKTEEEILGMSPTDLVAFLLEWTPPPKQEIGPEEITYGGLADVVGNVIISHFDRYREHLVTIALCHPGYAYQILVRFREGKQGGLRPWDALIELSEAILARDEIRVDLVHHSGASWRGVKVEIARLLEDSLVSESDPILRDYLPRVCTLLLGLADDPDPRPEDDRPPTGNFGHNDPTTVALNHVRPLALNGLVAYASRVAGATYIPNDPPGPSRWEPAVQSTFTARLDPRLDPSWAMRTVYGRHLPLLHWLDQQWLEDNLDDILPVEDDDESIGLFMAAWGSFVDHNQLPFGLLDLLRQKYSYAIELLGRGYFADSRVRTGRGLVRHVMQVFLHGEADLFQADAPQSLIAQFFANAPDKVRGDAIRHLCGYGQKLRQEFAEHWPKIKLLWKSRRRVASIAGHPPEFDEEMKWFAKLTLVAPESETIETLWPFLEALIPHVTRSQQLSIGRDALCEYLAREVRRDPLRAIQMYRLLYDGTSNPSSFYSKDHERMIIETAAADPTSREIACLLIDTIARQGDPERYRSIYDNFCR